MMDVVGVLKTFAICLGMTIVIELSFALLAGIRKKRELLLVVLVQIVTNPIVVFCMMWCYLHLNMRFPYFELPLEIGAVLVEWIFYKKFLTSCGWPFRFSLAANYISYSMTYVLAHYGIYW